MSLQPAPKHRHAGSPCSGCGVKLTVDNIFRGKRCKACRREYLEQYRADPVNQENQRLYEFAYRQTEKGKETQRRRNERLRGSR